MDYIKKTSGIPACDACGATIKPDVVLYEEGLDMDTMDAAVEAIRNADVLIIGGTSLVVYPAAGLVQYTRRGIPIYLIDPNAVKAGPDVVQIQKGASEGMKELCERLMK